MRLPKHYVDFVAITNKMFLPLGKNKTFRWNSLSRGSYPTNPFTIFWLRNRSHDVPVLHKIRRSPDQEALKLGKGSSGIRSLLSAF